MNAQKGAPFPLGISLACGLHSFFHLIMQIPRNRGIYLHRFSRSGGNKIETQVFALQTEQNGMTQQNEKRREGMARLERLELPTRCLEGSCSILLSYRRTLYLYRRNPNILRSS